MRTLSTRRWVATVAAAAAATLILAGCAGGADNGGDSGASNKDNVTYALPAGTGPNWLLPMSPPDKMATHNKALKSTMWVPLFEYDGTGGAMGWDKKASAAKSYEFSADGTSVKITLNDLDWSDGKPVTSRDVEFWYNLARYNNTKIGGYSAGNMPDNVTKFEINDDKNFTLTFDKVYNQDFLLANQLTLMYPMPQHVWDKTSDSEAVGDYDRDEAGAQKVLDYLFKQAEDMSTYATNPLWKTVDGPYTVGKWTDAGQVELTANEKYTGVDKAKIKNVTFMPFTSADAEMNVVRSGDVDYGYITSAQLSSKAQFEDLGYKIDPWKGWSITYMPYNFANPTMGPVYKQLYVRQALQHAIDQKSISDVIWKGAATPGYGPIPQDPATDYLSDEQKNNPYPFDLKASEKLFTDHGWKKNAQGVLTCENAGSGADQCGDGIAAGQAMNIVVTTQNGSQETDNMMAEIKSSLQKVGVNMTIDAIPLDSVLTEAQSCKTGGDCKWELVFFGTAGSWYFSAYPNGERVFAKDTKWNAGQYDNPEAEKLITDLTFSTDKDIAKKYSALLAQDLPVMWMPNPVYQVSVIKKGLDIGGQQDPGASFYPQRWSWK
ncbi:peptide ABC transporter substrate-binding protein [Mycetocola lacteus]|uniref:Peptide ABC transporter substrate-binding protein n=1 Tax=Mycetocola lacteus TaxID=76637 RepID=A0A3L7AL02_9MICO|nr:MULTISPECIES: peptide ABC transporter substrate-binding protein [Mycetocola]MCS4276692.1 peptide/nickel transport system substrate-binding protein [Mycetocola sp. BIGb0189]RLP80251.1 peptide ABC transporter substrate-binding protein [Mycetocola lacteus]